MIIGRTDRYRQHNGYISPDLGYRRVNAEINGLRCNLCYCVTLCTSHPSMHAFVKILGNQFMNNNTHFAWGLLQVVLY